MKNQGIFCQDFGCVAQRFSYGSKIPTAFLHLVSELWLIYEYRVTVFTLLGMLGLVLTQPSDFTEEAGSGPRNGRLPCEVEWSEGIPAPQT